MKNNKVNTTKYFNLIMLFGVFLLPIQDAFALGGSRRDPAKEESNNEENNNEENNNEENNNEENNNEENNNEENNNEENNNSGIKFSVNILNGKNSGRYTEGSVVNIEPSFDHWGLDFKEWKGADANLVRNKRAGKTSFTMPNRNVNLIATFSRNSQDQGKIRALMATDWFTMDNLWNRKKDELDEWRKAGINTIYSLVDLQARTNHPNCRNNRPHIIQGRSGSSINNQVIENIQTVSDAGFDIMVVMTNTWGIRQGQNRFGPCIGGFQGEDLQEDDLYNNSARVDREKRAWNDLKNKLDSRGIKIRGVVLALEPTTRSGINFMKQMASHIRSTGYTGRLYSNGIGDGRWDGGDSSVRSGRSLNTIDEWRNNSQAILNGDGFGSHGTPGHLDNDSKARQYIPEMTRDRSDKDGYILWFKEYIGNSNGPSSLKDWLYKYITFERDSNTNVGNGLGESSGSGSVDEENNNEDIIDVQVGEGNKDRNLQTPYPSGDHVIPGRIEAEDFDSPNNGSNMISYFDKDSGNKGNSRYRNEDVELQVNNQPSGINIGYMEEGEWIEYSIEAIKDANYRIKLNISKGNSGNSMYKVWVNDVSVGEFTVNDSGSWSNFVDYLPPFSFDLKKGFHKIGIEVVSAGVNETAGDLDWIEISDDFVGSNTDPEDTDPEDEIVSSSGPNSYCDESIWTADKNRSGEPLGSHKTNNLVKSAGSNGNLVVLLSCEYMKRSGTLGIYDGNNNLIENGFRKTDYDSPHNDNREDFRFSKPGRDYGVQTLRVQLNGQWHKWRGDLGGGSSGRVDFITWTKE